MSDESQTSESLDLKPRPSQQRGLLPPCRPGEVRNKTGRNQYSRMQAVIDAFMRETPDPSRPADTRFRRVLVAAYTSALKPGISGAADRKWLGEMVAGKPSAAPNEAQLALAEHFRKVEDQRFGYAMQLLGERVRAMSDAERAAFFNSLVVDKRSFVDAAEREPEAQEQLENGQPTQDTGSVPTEETGAASDGGEPTP